ncbi:MAG: ferrochelatase [Pseudomonadota bacterium]
MKYDAIILISFGGPEGPQEVIPFLENVLRGKNVPEGRTLEVAQHYLSFGGVSPLNAQNRDLKDRLAKELARKGLKLPVYWGNRNWKPYIKDALLEMKKDGVKRALAYVTFAYASYPGCRQYLEDIARARDEIGEKAPQVDKIRTFHNHPLFIEVASENVRSCLDRIPAKERKAAAIAFTAHSIPLAMSQSSDYLVQLEDTCSLIAAHVPHENWKLVFQSRSGPPSQAWLEPDIHKHLEELSRLGLKNVVVAPMGFVADHLEVIYDLDRQAKEAADRLDLRMFRAATPGANPKFVGMIVELIEERLHDQPIRRCLGKMGPGWDVCPPGCCDYLKPRPAAAAG